MKISYLQVISTKIDAGLYREWIQENYYFLYQKYYRLEKHIKKLAKLTKLSPKEIEKDIRESVGLKGNLMFID